MRQLRSIRFKNAASLMRHMNFLLSSWRYSAWRRQSDKSNAKAWARHQEAAKERTRAAHARACEQAYGIKVDLFVRGKGHNTTAGIPA